MQDAISILQKEKYIRSLTQMTPYLLRIETEELYPDGSNIDVYFSQTDLGNFLSDVGTTFTWISHLGAEDFSPSQREFVGKYSNVSILAGTIVAGLFSLKDLILHVKGLAEICQHVALIQI